MKTKITGWLFIIISSIFFLSFLILVIVPLLFRGGQVDDFKQLWQGGLALILGVYAFVLGSAIKSYKKWAWYAGIITIILALVGNIISFIFFTFSPSLIISLLLDVFFIYALISEKHLFFPIQQPTQTAPSIPTPPSTTHTTPPLTNIPVSPPSAE